MATIPPKLITAESYLETIIKSINQAKSLVYITVMIFGNDESIAPLVDALKNAKNRGIDVSLSADSFTFTEMLRPFRPHQYRTRPMRPVLSTRKELEKAGIKFHWLGNSSSVIISGRTHTKWIIADDTVYSLGGINLYDEGLSNTDFMFKVKDQELASKLVKEHKRIIESSKKGHAYSSHSFKTNFGTVLIDGGLFGESIIYRRALNLAKKADKITYVSQYCPSGRLGLILKEKNAKLYFNDWRHANAFNAIVIRAGVALSRNRSLYHHDRYLHAKYIIFEFADGSKKAITGSHNFTNGSVWMGTREIALETDSPKIIRQLESFTKKYIA